MKTDLNQMKKATKDESLIFDGYDADDRPLFTSIKNEGLEYTIDEDRNVWRHDGCTDKKICSLN